MSAEDDEADNREFWDMLEAAGFRRFAQETLDLRPRMEIVMVNWAFDPPENNDDQFRVVIEVLDDEDRLLGSVIETVSARRCGDRRTGVYITPSQEPRRVFVVIREVE